MTGGEPTLGAVRARQVCEAVGMEIAPDTVDNTRLEPERLAGHGIQAEAEQGLLARPRT